jgi:hypothetical protein
MKATLVRTSLLGAAALAWGCSSSSSSGSGTTGKAITLHTVANVQGDPTKPVTSALGWSVTLSKAYVSLDSLHYFQGEPVVSSNRVAPARSRWARWLDLFERTAHAHPGHYIPGAAMGEMLTPTTLDLLVPSTQLADGTGVTGWTYSGRFTWRTPPVGDKAASLEGHVVLTEGVATKGETTLRFRATADAADVFDGNGVPEVDGCALGDAPGHDGVDIEGDGTITLTIVPSVWFDEVEFTYALPVADGGAGDAGGASDAGASDAPVDIAGTLAWRGFVRGLKKGTAYVFSYGK